ncbi:hypothetical protein GE061_010093 [Apolygus lucorum]|uniref:DUF4794 domain-containing protein n=1 Tax=Apolygus lucorum TaxID=248454 RepID=A0A8S9Y449_APOLU|nr:hypothetical protein GE061_010093 [Apolygus lucorum]
MLKLSAISHRSAADTLIIFRHYMSRKSFSAMIASTPEKEEPCRPPASIRFATMKVSCLVLVIASALADKAPYPPSSGPYPPSSAPYPPSGWKPSGNLLLLPQQEYGPPPPPSPPQGYGPPQDYGPPSQTPPPQEYGPPQNETTPAPEEDLEKVNERIMERLRQEEGSDTGVYYVYLPDGRLQRVQYTSAPLKAAPQPNQQGSFSNTQQVNQQSSFGSHQVSSQSNSQSFGRFGSFAKQQTSYDAPAYPPAPAAPSRFSAQFSQFNQQGSARYDGSSKVSTNNQEVEIPGSPSQIFAKYTKTEEFQPQAAARLNEEQEQPSKYVASVSFTDVAPITGPIYSYNNQPLVRVLRYAPLFQ